MFHTILTLLVLHVIALSSPGPDTLMVIRESSLGKHNGFACAFGISLGVLVYSLLIILGLSLLLQQYHFIHYLISLFGAVYLFYVGIKLIKSRGMKETSFKKHHVKLKRKSIKTGFITNISNPKAMIYFTSVFSQFKIVGIPQIAFTIFAITAVTWLWFSMVARVVSTQKIRHLFFQKSAVFDKISGGLFLLFAAALMADMLFHH